MIDGVIKGTGDSRYLKSAIAPDATWEQFRDALRAGTLPIDLFGLNAAGWTALATSLSKANLLSDATVTALEAAVGTALSSDTPDKALAAIASVIGKNGVQIETGSYVGTGTGGSEGTATTLSFGFAPKFMLVAAGGNTGVFAFFSFPILTTSFTEYAYRPDDTYSSYVRAKKSSDGKTIYFYVASSYGSYVRLQANTSGVTYYYVAIG
jgi:hypothetical protein